MSVDDRLREAFAETDHTWDDRIAAALREVTVRERRERVTRRTAITAAAAAVTAAVVLVAANTDDRDELPAPQPPTPSPTAETGNPVDGRWVSSSLTRADVRRVARLAGGAADAATMLGSLPGVPFRIALTIDGDRNELITHVRYGRREDVIDQENVELDGDRLTLTPQFADGASVHGWSLTGDTLRLTFLSTTEAGTDGVPAEAWQRLLYDTVAFTREG